MPYWKFQLKCVRVQYVTVAQATNLFEIVIKGGKDDTGENVYSPVYEQIIQEGLGRG